MDRSVPRSGTVPDPSHLLTEGKTKRVYRDPAQPDQVIVVSKDDITAGDGAKHDVLSNKGELATRTTCNVFRLLLDCGVEVAFLEQLGETIFRAKNCRMLPYEVVTRREAHGSYLKRNPHVKKGQLFPRLIVEYYLKTSGRTFKGHELPCDDPLMRLSEDGRSFELFAPGAAFAAPFLTLPVESVYCTANEAAQFPAMESMARRCFLILEKAWQLEGKRLADMKIEFGLDSTGKLLLADVIDNDSWRVVEDDRYIDKQLYRDGGSLDAVASTYRRVADLTAQFRVPSQRIILWRGSPSDNFEPFEKALGRFANLTVQVTCSAHKQPIAASLRFAELVQQHPDSVVVAYIGRSNGAGPILSASSTLPVITVPASAQSFPDDVWSCLRAPSAVPVLTVLDPSNAILAALQILSARNPAIYAELRLTLEERFTNVVEL